jgi:DNA-directed RNA polymerase specialized sigma24 family protein
MARYQTMVRAVAGSFRMQEADAADAVQNTWLRALERLHTVREPERLGGWAEDHGRRECLSLLSAAGRERAEEEIGEALVDPAGRRHSSCTRRCAARCASRRRAVGPPPDAGRRAVFGWPGNYAAASWFDRDAGGQHRPDPRPHAARAARPAGGPGVEDAGGGCGVVGWELPMAADRPGLPVARPVAPPVCRLFAQPAGGGAGR